MSKQLQDQDEEITENDTTIRISGEIRKRWEGLNTIYPSLSRYVQTLVIQDIERREKEAGQ